MFYFIANFDFLLYMIYDFWVNLFSLIVLLPCECIFKINSKISYIVVLLFNLQYHSLCILKIIIISGCYCWIHNINKWNPFIDFICQLRCSISYILECNILIRFPPLKVECFEKMRIWFASRNQLWIFLTQVTWSVCVRIILNCLSACTQCDMFILLSFEVKTVEIRLLVVTLYNTVLKKPLQLCLTSLHRIFKTNTPISPMHVSIEISQCITVIVLFILS